MEVAEAEQQLFDEIKELNVSIASAERRGNSEVKTLLEKELAEARTN